jgi:N-acetyl-anhydromuramyl-L-alanine amidase AmpD
LPLSLSGCATLYRASRRFLLPVLLAGLVACGPVRNPMARWVPSPNYDQRRPVAIVIHFTDQDSVQESLHTLRTANSGGPVSAHYLIGSDGGIYQLVADSKRAWQAGPGRWGTITDLNSSSIGIELDNNGHSPFAPAQIDSLLRLLADLTTRLHIPPTQVIGHEDLAPGRKDDPGPLFPWARLAEAGYGLWPRGPLVDPPPGFDPWMALALVGYPLDDRPAAVRSFHHHFRGIDGDTLDAQDLRVLYALACQLTGTPATLAVPVGSQAAGQAVPPR